MIACRLSDKEARGEPITIENFVIDMMMMIIIIIIIIITIITTIKIIIKGTRDSYMYNVHS